MRYKLPPRSPTESEIAALVARNRARKGLICKYSPETVDSLVSMYVSGLNMREIMERTGIPKASVKEQLKKRGVEMRGKARKYVFNEHFFDVIDSEEKAYWLGFLAADGNVGKALYTVTVKLKADDLGHIQKWQRAMGSTHPISVKDDKAFGGTFSGATVHVNSKILARALNALGVTPNKSKTMLPWVSGSSELQRHYWRGMVDGDGWFSFYKNGAAVMGLLGNIATVTAFSQWINSELGFETAPSAHDTIFKVQYGSVKAAAVSRLLYQDASVFLDRKKECADRAQLYLGHDLREAA